MNDILKMNKAAFSYSSCASEVVKEVCKPLESMGIAFFRYLKVYPDCSYLTLMNGFNDFLTAYYDTIEDLGNIWGANTHFAYSVDDPFYLIWPNERDCKDINMSLFNHYNIRNGISLFYRVRGYVEIISFAFNNSLVNDANNRFINALPFFKKFVIHFREVAVDLISFDKKKLAVFPKKFNIDYTPNSFTDEVKLLSNEFKTKKLVLHSSKGLVKLTDRESECLKLLAHGDTMKKAASTLTVSPRTIEMHLANIKAKTKCRYKSDLIRMYFEQYE